MRNAERNAEFGIPPRNAEFAEFSSCFKAFFFSARSANFFCHFPNSFQPKKRAELDLKQWRKTLLIGAEFRAEFGNKKSGILLWQGGWERGGVFFLISPNISNSKLDQLRHY